MLAGARELAQRVRRLAMPDDPGISCIFCGAALYASERSLQVQCKGCHQYVHVRELRIRSAHGVPRTVTSAGIVVEANGRVTGDLYARSVEVHGRVMGNVFATGECRLGPTAKVAGHILCGQLHVETGAVIDGTIERIAE